MNSGTTKASGTVSSSLGSNFESMKIMSTQGSSNGTSFAQNQKVAFDKGNLAIIQEELMVEEGCENELESNRQTI